MNLVLGFLSYIIVYVLQPRNALGNPKLDAFSTAVHYKKLLQIRFFQITGFSDKVVTTLR